MQLQHDANHMQWYSRTAILVPTMSSKKFMSLEKFSTIILFKDEWTAATNATASYRELSHVCAMLEHEDLDTNKTATHCIGSRPTSCSTF
jgi:hypothetical protein